MLLERRSTSSAPQARDDFDAIEGILHAASPQGGADLGQHLQHIAHDNAADIVGGQAPQLANRVEQPLGDGDMHHAPALVAPNARIPEFINVGEGLQGGCEEAMQPRVVDAHVR